MPEARDLREAQRRAEEAGDNGSRRRVTIHLGHADEMIRAWERQQQAMTDALRSITEGITIPGSIADTFLSPTTMFSDLTGPNVSSAAEAFANLPSWRDYTDNFKYGAVDLSESLANLAGAAAPFAPAIEEMLSYPETQALLSSPLSDFEWSFTSEEWTYDDVKRSIDSIAWVLDDVEEIDWTYVDAEDDVVDVESARVTFRSDADSDGEPRYSEIYLSKREAALLQLLVFLVCIGSGARPLDGQEIAGMNAFEVWLMYSLLLAHSMPTLFERSQ